MEVVDGCSAVYDLPVSISNLSLDSLSSVRVQLRVVIISELQESLQSSRRVFSTISIITVRQEENKSSRNRPLCLTRSDVVVDHDLRSVGEISELSLPHDEDVRVHDGVPVLESEDSVFGEVTVLDVEELLLNLLLGQESVEWNILLVLNLVVQHSMSVREGSSFDVLAGKTDSEPFVEKSSPSEGLSRSHIDSFSRGDGLESRFEDLLDLGVQGHGARDRGELNSDLLELGDGDGGVFDLAELGRLLGRLPLSGGPLLYFEGLMLRVVEGLLQPLLVLAFQLRNEGLIDDSLTDQFLGVELGDGQVLIDDLVHDGLREPGHILLVVAESAVADEVDDYVLLESLSEFEGDDHDLVNDVWLVRVDVEDGTFDRLGDLTRVGAGTVLSWGRGESDLVVDDDVEGSVGGESVQVAHLEGLVDDSLSADCGVSVDDDAHGVVSLAVLGKILDGSSGSHDAGIDGLKVGRVGDNSQIDTLVSAFDILTNSKVVLYVSGSSVAASILLDEEFFILEFGHDFFERFLEDRGEDIESSSVRHSDDDVLDSGFGRSLDHGFESGDEGITALDSESLGQEFFAEVLIEDIVFDEVLKSFDSLIAIEFFVGEFLDSFLDPVSLFLGFDMVEFSSEFPGVDFFGSVDDFTKSPDFFFSQEISDFFKMISLFNEEWRI